MSANGMNLTVLRTSDDSNESRSARKAVTLELEALGTSLQSAGLKQQQAYDGTEGPGTPTYGVQTPEESSRPNTIQDMATEGSRRTSGSATALAATDVDAQAEEVDGGFQAWLVVAGCCLFFTVILGLVYSFGVLQEELIRRGVASASTLGWVSSLSVLPAPLLATPFAYLVERFGTSRIALLGALLTSTGYILTSFALHSVTFLFIAQTIFGCGYGAFFWSCGSISATWFTRRRGLATGIVYAGSGVGGAIFSIALAAMIKRLGAEWAVRIFGLFALFSLVPTSFVIRERVKVRARTWSLALFRNFDFTLLWIATAAVTFTLYVPSFFLPTYAASAGYSTSTGAWLVAGYNLASAVGRVLFGLLADTRVGPVTTLILAMTIMAISILCVWVVSSSLPALIVFLLASGSAGGALFSLQPTVNASLFGLKDIALTMAMITFSRTIGTALGGPIAGYLLDAFGGPQSGVDAFRPALLLFGGLSLASAALVLVVRWRVAGWDLKKRV